MLLLLLSLLVVVVCVYFLLLFVVVVVVGSGGGVCICWRLRREWQRELGAFLRLTTRWCKGCKFSRV